MELNARVKVFSKHWLRPSEEGVTVDFTPRGENHWCVKFASSYPGGGIDGDKLWLSETQLQIITNGNGNARKTSR